MRKNARKLMAVYSKGTVNNNWVLVLLKRKSVSTHK